MEETIPREFLSIIYSYYYLNLTQTETIALKQPKILSKP